MFNTKYGKTVLIDSGGMSTLQRYSPGNVRELQNIVERIVIISEPNVVVGGPRIAGLLDMDPFVSDNTEESMGLYELVEATERRMIEKALRIGARCGCGNAETDQSTIVVPVTGIR